MINKEKPPIVADLFDVQHMAGESLKSYLNKFNGVAIRVRDPNEQMAMMRIEGFSFCRVTSTSYAD